MKKIEKLMLLFIICVGFHAFFMQNLELCILAFASFFGIKYIVLEIKNDHPQRR